MDVILKRDVDGLGHRGDVVSVANGYYRNYLLPKGLGYKATKGAEVEAEAMRKANAVRHAEDRGAAEELATTLVPQVFTIPARVAAGGTLFGSVGVTDIIAAVEAQAGIKLDKKSIKLDSPLKEVGSHMVTTQIHADVQFPVTVEVVPED